MSEMETREIKFRVFDTTTKKYLTPKGGDFSLGVLSGEVRGKYGELFSDLKVEQFSGMYDANGVEIYEGDQLYICSGYSSTVAFQDGMFVSIYQHPEDGEIIPLVDAIGKDTVIIT